MKRLFFCLLTAVLAVFLLAACTPPAEEAPPSTSSEDLTAALRSLYIQAAKQLSGAENFSAVLSTEKTTVTQGHTFTESSVQEFSFLHYGKDYMLADLKESYRVGSHTVAITEHFDSGVCASQIQGAGFVSNLSAKDYEARFAPLLLLDESLYGTITVSDQEDRRILTFTDHTGPEAWTGIAPEHVVDVTANAVLNSDGRLLESRYSITWRSGEAVVTKTVTASLNTEFVPSLEAFPDTTEYVQISHPDIPRLLEQSCGYVLQATAVTSRFTETITCQAGGLSRTQEAILDLLTADGDLKALLERNITLVDHTQNDSTSSSKQTELFLNGSYYQNDLPMADSGIDRDHMLTYCQDLLVFPILLPKHTTGMTIYEVDNTWVLEFTTTRELSDVIAANASQALYKNPDLLNDLSSAYEVNYTSGRLVLDKDTGLPKEASLKYSGTHTIAGYAYALKYDLTQQYDLTSQSAQGTIDSSSPQTSPERA